VNQKLLIIVLVALVVIFVIAVGIGGCHGSGRTDRPGPVNALKGLQGKRFLVIGDKTKATCAGPGAVTFIVNGVCTITFEKRPFFKTSTRVVFVPNASVRVLVDPKNGPRQDEQVDQFKCFGSAIDHAGGTMTLIANNATITLLRQACPS
jgi:hypothetical protein